VSGVEKERSAGRTREQIGYKPHHLTPPNVDQHRQASPQVKAHSDRQGTGRSCLNGATSASAARFQQSMPSPGEQSPGWPSTSMAGARQAGIPSTSPRAPTRCPGASLASSTGGEYEISPRGSAWSGCAKPTGCHQSCGQDRLLHSSKAKHQPFSPPPREPRAGARIGRDQPQTAGHS
jgi:hypothetical protein